MYPFLVWFSYFRRKRSVAVVTNVCEPRVSLMPMMFSIHFVKASTGDMCEKVETVWAKDLPTLIRRTKVFDRCL